MKIKDLPEVIKKRALECQSKQGNVYNENLYLDDSYESIFDWDLTDEGGDIWNGVNNGNFQPFYDFHKISPVPEWAPKEGEMVIARGDRKYPHDCDFIFTTKEGTHIVRDKNGRVVEVEIIEHPIPPPRLTRTEIAEKFGVSKDFELIDE